MTRVPYPPGVSAVGDDEKGRLNIQRMLAYLPATMQSAFQTLAKAILWEGDLDPSIRELAIVRVGHLSRSEYELHHHVPFAARVGVSQETIAAMAHIAPTGLSEPHQAVVAFIDEMVLLVRPSDQALDRLRKHLSDANIIELIVAAGYYMTVCRLLEATGVEPEAFTLNPNPAGSR